MLTKGFCRTFSVYNGGQRRTMSGHSVCQLCTGPRERPGDEASQGTGQSELGKIMLKTTLGSVIVPGSKVERNNAAIQHS